MKSKVIFKSYVNGQCAKCKSEDIWYEELVLEEEMAFFPYHCDHCEHDGREWYKLEYTESE